MWMKIKTFSRKEQKRQKDYAIRGVGARNENICKSCKAVWQADGKSFAYAHWMSSYLCSHTRKSIINWWN